MKALSIERAEGLKVRALIWEMDENGFRSILDIAEADNLADLQAWFDDNWVGNATYARLPNGEWDRPDEITTWEAAEAAM